MKRFLLNYLNFGLLILDNIHFQYNSFLYGLMIMSLVYIKEVKYILKYLEIILQKCFSLCCSTQF